MQIIIYCITVNPFRWIPGQARNDERVMSELAKYSDEWFLSLYLMCGSVEETVKCYPENLPMSVANYHRLVRKHGLIKSAGRHVSLPETLHFFRLKAAEPGTPLEKLYRGMPLRFQTSLSTLHRIYQYMEKQLVRRYAAALIITSGDKGQVLVGREVFGNSRYGKRVGNFSVPMSFAKKDEPHTDSVLRVLQQEVFSGLAAGGKLKKNSEIVSSILSQSIEPFAYFDIVDVCVRVYRLDLGQILQDFSSHKLTGHSFINITELQCLENIRAGVDEILGIYEGFLHNPYTVEFPMVGVSEINAAIVMAPSQR